MAIPMLKIRRPLGRLIFNMGIAIPGKTVFLIETAPSFFSGRIASDLLYYLDRAITWLLYRKREDYVCVKEEKQSTLQK